MIPLCVICCCALAAASDGAGSSARSPHRNFRSTTAFASPASKLRGHSVRSFSNLASSDNIVSRVISPSITSKAVPARTAPKMALSALQPGPTMAFGAVVGSFLQRNRLVVLAIVIVSALVKALKMLDRPSRIYDQETNTVGEEYDAWTADGILEYYWGEHIHLGYYTDEELAKGYKKKDFIGAKVDFTDEMFKWSGATQPKTLLDVGCGIGGTSRHLAKKLPGCQVTGITLSPNQQARATRLAKEQGVSNAQFKVMDALNMDFPDNSFDMVWACESGEHMPDKKKYVEEMSRVLKPGGHIVIATWCQRETPPEFNSQERKTLDYLYGEWTHPYFISIEEYGRLMEGTGKLEKVGLDDWNKNTIASWRHSIWVGVYDPWIVVRKPWAWWKTIKDGVCLERMHRAFDCGLMKYGMMKAVKKAAPEA